MILGLRTVSYVTPNLAAGKAWYTQMVGHGPYFDEPYYVGFQVGGFELGLVPDGTPGPGGAVAHWGTKDAATDVARLLALGATIVDEVKDVGDGIIVATLADPFGNLIGIIQNPHFRPEAVA
jgi:predicted enzyme related to lactoylglutathione lyase